MNTAEEAFEQIESCIKAGYSQATFHIYGKPFDNTYDIQKFNNEALAVVEEVKSRYSQLTYYYTDFGGGYMCEIIFERTRKYDRTPQP